MENTVDLLFYEIKHDKPISLSVLHDYFGIDNLNNSDNINIIYGIYAGLIKYKSVNKELFENCFITNRLDELIHVKYTFRKSSYYDMFCEKRIKIGNTYFNLKTNEENDTIEDIEYLPITTDDYCPTCNIAGYVTKNNYDTNCPPDCFKCFKFVCKLCSNFDEDNYSRICYMCESPNIKIAILNKIRSYQKSDKNKFGYSGNIRLEDVTELLNKQKFRCYVCDDIVLTFGYKPRCFYQFSVDRIDNSLPHNRNNILISCYYCNCIDYLTNLDCNDNTKHKICNNLCHSEKRNISIKREDVSIDKINSLKLS